MAGLCEVGHARNQLSATISWLNNLEILHGSDCFWRMPDRPKKVGLSINAITSTT